MRVALCMIVRDEAARIENCLRDIHDAFEQVVVVDTGSSDRTCDILRQRFRIDPLSAELSASECFSKAPARNLAFSRVRAPWILSLDADERLSRPQLDALLGQPDPPDHAGIFLAWSTFRDGGQIGDYKLALFRRGLKSQGRVHENVQPSLRQAGLSAQWSDRLEIAHFPDPSDLERKRAFYRHRLECALAKQPTWFRYHWFLGHLHYLQSELDTAAHYLATAARAQSMDFPVECLNSMMLLAEIYARRERKAELGAVLRDMWAFYSASARDFEVRVNTRLEPWMVEAREHLAGGRLEAIRAYVFPY
jgi:glycosyltransferase involved in cell wall biosynthesis